jgi:hypothetical protein
MFHTSPRFSLFFLFGLFSTALSAPTPSILEKRRGGGRGGGGGSRSSGGGIGGGSADLEAWELTLIILGSIIGAILITFLMYRWYYCRQRRNGGRETKGCAVPKIIRQTTQRVLRRDHADAGVTEHYNKMAPGSPSAKSTDSVVEGPSKPAPALVIGKRET